MSTETEQKTEKPRGRCAGCDFEYTLSLARSGEHKGELVTRKHNSRTGPGLCEGAQKPPKAEKAESSLVAELRAAGAFDLPHDIAGGDLIQSDDGTVTQDLTRVEHTYDDGNGGVWAHPGSSESCTLPECAEIEQQRVNAAAAGINSVMAIADPSPMTNAAFVDPAPMPAELPPVSGQPEPDRDRWSRYLLPGPDGRKQPHTRATSFAKLGSSTFALSEWGERMLIKGLTERPDLLALAHGLDVKRDKKQLNGIADDAQTHAGNKVAANIGTAYHAFTERLDAGLITLADVPEQYRARCEQYVDAIRVHGLTTRAEWIERTTAVRADQVSAPVPVAGTLDRIWQLPNGELVIGDLKTGSDLSYGWAEIAVQLAIYAHGCNTHGLFDWNTKTWQLPPYDGRRPVRTDYAIVMHLPADGDGCTLYRVDLVKGWGYAQVSGMVQSRQKDKSLAGVLVPGSLAAPVPQPDATEPLMERASRLIDASTHADELITLLKHAGESGRFTPEQFEELKGLCGLRWRALQA